MIKRYDVINDDDIDVFMTEDPDGDYVKHDDIKRIIWKANHLIHLHMCEQEGISCGMPSPEEWMKAVDELHNAINGVNNDKRNNINNTDDSPNSTD